MIYSRNHAFFLKKIVILFSTFILIFSLECQTLQQFEEFLQTLKILPGGTLSALCNSDPHGHNIKLDSLKTSVAFKYMIILQNLMTTDRKSSKSKHGSKLTELDVV